MTTPETEIVDIVAYASVTLAIFVCTFLSDLTMYVAAVGIVKYLLRWGIIGG